MKKQAELVQIVLKILNWGVFESILDRIARTSLLNSDESILERIACNPLLNTVENLSIYKDVGV